MIFLLNLSMMSIEYIDIRLTKIAEIAIKIKSLYIPLPVRKTLLRRLEWQPHIKSRGANYVIFGWASYICLLYNKNSA